MRKLLLCLSLLSAGVAQAHDGHGDTPGAVSAPHGGKIFPMPEMYLEVVKSGKKIKVYPLTHELKAIPLDKVKFSAKIEVPKQKGMSPASVEPGDESWLVSAEAKGARRYTLHLEASYGGKKSTAKYNVEQ